MRIDRVRNQAHAAIELLHTTLRHLNDLHTLAYDRPSAAERLAIRGGERDYALDTHGDPHARDLLRQGMRITDTTCADLARWAHDIAAYLNDGERTHRRTTPTATATDVNDALDAQARRRQRGDYTPQRTAPQPTDTLLAELRELRRQLTERDAELSALRAENDKLTALIPPAEPRYIGPRPER